MFCIEIAGIPIGLDNRYPNVRHLCSEYVVSGSFAVSAGALAAQPVRNAAKRADIPKRRPVRRDGFGDMRGAPFCYFFRCSYYTMFASRPWCLRHVRVQ